MGNIGFHSYYTYPFIYCTHVLFIFIYYFGTVSVRHHGNWRHGSIIRLRHHAWPGDTEVFEERGGMFDASGFGELRE